MCVRLACAILLTYIVLLNALYCSSSTSLLSSTSIGLNLGSGVETIQSIIKKINNVVIRTLWFLSQFRLTFLGEAALPPLLQQQQLVKLLMVLVGPLWAEEITIYFPAPIHIMEIYNIQNVILEKLNGFKKLLCHIESSQTYKRNGIYRHTLFLQNRHTLSRNCIKYK